MKKKVVIVLALIVAAAIVYGSMTLLSPKPQYVLVSTDSGPGPRGRFAPPEDRHAPSDDMTKPDSQPNKLPAAGKANSIATSETAQKPATVSVEEDNGKSAAKQPGMPPMETDHMNGRKMPSAMRSTFELVRTIMEIGRLDESKKDPVTASQAKAILAVINPLRSKKTLSEAQAKTAASKLNAILTSAQKKAISELPRMGMRRPEGQKGEQRPSGPPPDGTRPSGPPPNMGARPDMDMNPLSSSSKSPMAEHINKMMKALEVKAKG